MQAYSRRETFVVYRARIDEKHHPTRCTETFGCKLYKMHLRFVVLEMLALGDTYRRQEATHEAHAISARLGSMQCHNAHQIKC